MPVIHTQDRLRRARAARRAFTLVQLLITIGVVAILAAILLPAFARSRATARRAQCDMRLKAIALALDAYRQENHHYPEHLSELRGVGLLNDPDALRCPSDPRPVGEGSYDDYYVLRTAHDANDLPIVVCPFHEDDGYGAQAYKGRYTTQFATRPAQVVRARSVVVRRPGKQPIAAAPGMTLRGGDRLIADSSGAATIRFADGSTATLNGDSDVTVLQSFLMGETNAPLYTLLKQALGTVDYDVHSGSSFDVATPTATAGARGTTFTVTVHPDGRSDLVVESGKVLFTTLDRTIVAPLGHTVTGLLDGLINIL
jgi:type II secretory pathway pseudopilin PulG